MGLVRLLAWDFGFPRPVASNRGGSNFGLELMAEAAQILISGYRAHTHEIGLTYLVSYKQGQFVIANGNQALMARKKKLAVNTGGQVGREPKHHDLEWRSQLITVQEH